MKINTIAIHKGTLRDKTTGGVNTPVYTSSAYAYINREDTFYPRYFNTPNQDAVAKKIAALEHAETGLVFSSGMGAMSTAILAFAGTGDHVVMLDALYGGTHYFATQWFSHFGIDCTFTKTTAEDVINQVTSKTKVIVIESPTNPLLAVVDIEKIARFARQEKITTIIDNTFASPVNQTPLDLGIDIVVHSGTKYLGGHSDLCCGMVACSGEKLEKILSLARGLGPSLDPRSCYLLERSMKTLVLRVTAQTRTAMEVANFLESRPDIAAVYYPGLECFKGHEIAKRQMTGFGAMLSFEIKDKDPDRFIEELKIISPAVSLGGVESTICSPSLTSHAKMSSTERLRIGVTDSLLRLSIGLEDADDLKQDLDAALKKG
ncbi:MAG: PLP-dependent aspartate aminotransferase family protein [Proteobacteria bacterium]|nr:PLP-dependent aspartate aminotransferase family protein [Pseudomonadota bacterium]MBU1582886.1 PLP-dependent aspartate aminotransferase family protein [Pseudomonadota bacterium]MBU2451958.1 PLP-dependent aspartate aminotransferase family protein [Pseudomonadota bacterium]MBU2631709.1 PLP-dependent aspartate aminotransferase family protein [Pseudomonadota bacterium]